MARSKSSNQANHVVNELRKKIPNCFGRDRGRLYREIKQFSQLDNSASSKLDSLKKKIDDSRLRVESRRDKIPAVAYPDTLPVSLARDQILDTVRDNQVTIVCGDTGSGKTTQLPKMCLELGRGVFGFVGHTQPRRIAARSVSSRIASELQTDIGTTVGYKTRFEQKLGKDSLIKVMTDGILLAEIQSDRWLNQYDTLIIDEAHERSLNIDFLLGYLKQLLPKRPDLKVIITSATIDPERFARHFCDAPVILVEGRTYPVELRYQPLQAEEDRDERDINDAIIDSCAELFSEFKHGGDALVFLPGERHIRECIEAIAKQAVHKRSLMNVEVVPLFARLSASEQAKIFASHGSRRIVLATNVAETSLTVQGIHYVIDTGVARLSRYSLRSKIQRLPIEKISRASANQRAGRCGREAPGVCVRLYSEEDFESRSEFTDPEILRTNLASVVLQMEDQKLGAIEEFPFIQKPDSRVVRDAYRLLFELGAVNEHNVLTKLGKKLSRLPLDPRLARMLIAASDEQCLDEILTIASALSIIDPRERPADKKAVADELHAEFKDEQSDFSAILNLWAFLDVQWQRLSHNQFRKMCAKRYLSYLRIREWQDVRKQLRMVCGEMGFVVNSEGARYDCIHRAILTGLLSNVCLHNEKREFTGTRNRKTLIFPGSFLRNTKAKWIVAAEISETSNTFARTVAKIEVEWVEQAASHLLKFSYSEPTWRKKQGYVSAKRKSTLHGLLVNPGKWVNYGSIDALIARDIFIRDGLVEGALNSNAAFYRHNLSLVDEVIALENKSRRRDLLVTPDEMYRFYDHVIPEGICSLVSFDTWRKEFERESPTGLYFEYSDVFQEDEIPQVDNDFPDFIEMGGASFPLRYSFSPGSEDDGVTMCVPVSVLNRVDKNACEWLVPGLLHEKVTALIKSLPKPVRRNFVPAPDFAARCIESFSTTEHKNTGLVHALHQKLSSLSQVRFDQNDFDSTAIAVHLTMRFEVIDEKGQVLGTRRSIAELQKQFAKQTAKNIAHIVSPGIERDNINDWNFGDLPESMEITRGEGKATVKLLGYPTLLCENDQIHVRVVSTENEAQRHLFAGVRALLQRVLKSEHRYITQRLSGFDALSLIYAPFASGGDLRSDLADAAFDTTFLIESALPRTREVFYQLISEHQRELLPNATTMLELVDTSLRAYQAIARRMGEANQLSWIEPMQDIRDQLDSLLAPGFVSRAGMTWLSRYPVYMQAIDRRLDAIDKSPDQDRRKRAELLPLWEQYQTLDGERAERELDVTELERCRWLFEELRISLFAQSLGTREKISIARLEKYLSRLS
ncbi:MAG: ATP-dependent RNA helicase HrpA [Pseudomonadota bacterium]